MHDDGIEIFIYRRRAAEMREGNRRNEGENRDIDSAVGRGQAVSGR